MKLGRVSRDVPSASAGIDFRPRWHRARFVALPAPPPQCPTALSGAAVLAFRRIEQPWSQPRNGVITRDALCPPKPKELLTAARSFASRGWCGT